MDIKKIIIPVSFNNGCLDYLNATGNRIDPGSLVIVPFRQKLMLGLSDGSDGKEKVDVSKLKPVNGVLDLKLSENLVKFIMQSAEYNLGNYGDFFKMAVSILDEKLIAKILTTPIEQNNFNLSYPELNSEQTEAFQKLCDLYESNQHSVSLFEGVTGSGKTEVYFSLIMKSIQDGKQALLLLPEICLTSQMIDRFKKRFGFEPVIWHSSITTKQRKDALIKIITGNAKVIIGARSALFLPYKSLGVVIVDEEHEQSYKQEEQTLYHARDMAILRAYIEKIPVLLCSATPSMETVYNVLKGKYHHITLKERYSGFNLPEVKLIDMRNNKDRNFVSEELRKEIVECISRGKQAILFLNRRGFAPLMLCRTCGTRISCPDCSSWLVTHFNKKIMRCHHCDYTIKIPEKCGECGDEQNLVACGPGVERVASEVEEFLPQAKVLVMSRDHIDDMKSYSETLKAIENKEYNCIIGTQLIAKGLHFKHLDLVGVIDADMGLKGGDLRSAERTFQLISQVGGRAGRESDTGKVFIQTYYPESSLIQAIANYDQESFTFNELKDRKESNMPPFSKLAAIVISDFNEQKLKQFIREMYLKAPANKDVHVLGPTEAIMYKLKNRYRYRFLLVSPKNFNLQKYIKIWMNEIKSKIGVIRIKIDIDPASFN